MNPTVVKRKRAPTPDIRTGSGPDYIDPALWPLAVPDSSLTVDPRNARTHDERNVGAIAASLKRFGQRAPIVVQRNGMIVRAGNGRLIAARSLGWESIAAVVVDESDVDAAAFAIADNRTSELAGWDDGQLAELLKSLPAADRFAAGFDDADLAAVLARLDHPAPMPSPPQSLAESGPPTGQYGVIVVCTDEAHQRTVYEQLASAGHTCRVVCT